ncbi:MAG: lipopolysaccharide heptosyltransferase I [Bryobacteraceae bacterium]|nr:lipopolysaccharide heptosyltransferase I [Bryobacteraceae bacterium]MDW8376569.1 lipopolysaccharide heptosyltransferase I [Bryobacterales bacterium]
MTSAILVVRLGAMGDVIHTLPAVVSLKQSFPNWRLVWVIDPRWAPLLEGNPFVDKVIVFDRKNWSSMRMLWRSLRSESFHVALDFQGLIKSALVAKLARAEKTIGYGFSQLREPAAALFYSLTFRSQARHIVDRHLELAAYVGARRIEPMFPLPSGSPEGHLPEGGYVLASPFAGWPAKEWPLANYVQLARLLRQRWGLPLVLNTHPSGASKLAQLEGTVLHVSSLAGLIDATRRARAVVGVDSGPLHLAAALGKPGVAIFGPTDPERNGPYGRSMVILRSSKAQTSYQRKQSYDDSMRAISAEQVADALAPQLG